MDTIELLHKKKRAEFVLIITMLFPFLIVLLLSIAVCVFDYAGGCKNYILMTILGGLFVTDLIVFLLALKFILPFLRLIEKNIKETDLLKKRNIVNRKHLRKLATAVEQSPESVVITHYNGDIDYVNPAFCRLTGFIITDVLGKNPSIMQSGLTPHSTYESLWKTIKSGKVWRGEIQNRKKSGELFWEDTSIAPIFGEEVGQIIGFVGVKKDVTQQREDGRALKHLTTHLEEEVSTRTLELQNAVEEARLALKEAKSANLAKSEFLANMSHELRTPLHAIYGFADLSLKRLNNLLQRLKAETSSEMLNTLYERFGVDQKSLENDLILWVSRILESQRRQLNLINNLLDLEKLESGKVEYHFKYSDFLLSVRSIVEELDPLVKDKQLTVKIEKSEVSTQATFDRDQMRCVIRNILSNSIKFTPKGGKITLSFVSGKLGQEDALHVQVEDTGCGIPKKELEFVFEKFAQSSLTKTGAGGTGLGLSICREIVHAHGGKISAKNSEYGGAIFSVTLPKKPMGRGKTINRDLFPKKQ